MRSSLLVFSALLCLTWGWQPGTQYVYNYVGRSMAGINQLKKQNAAIELQSRVIVQSHDERTLVVKLSDGRIKRNGNYVDHPYFTGEYSQSGFEIIPGHPQEIEGEEDRIANPQWLNAPFIITHNKGSFTGIKIGSDEPLWIVNYKKSIASQLQMDITGVRRDGSAHNWQTAPKEGESSTFTAFEDSITGDCSTTISISRLPWSHVNNGQSDLKLGSFDAICKHKPVYQIVKTKDFNRCQSNPVWYSAIPSTHSCEFGKSNCGDFMKRTSVFKYIACGETYSSLTVVHASGFSDLLVKPFATETEDLANSVIINWSLEKKGSFSSRFATPSSIKEHKTLAYSFDEFKQSDQNDDVPVQPNLRDAYIKSPVPVATLSKNLVDSLRVVARNLKERPDSEQDNIERLVVIGRVMPMFSFTELKSLWQKVKSLDYATVTLFVDCLVQSGSNPAIMLIKELVETEQITGTKATWALAAVGYYVKTPTRELLHQLVNLYKSRPVQSSKTMKQTTLMTIADLLNAACGSRFSSAKRFPVAFLGDLCDRKSPVIIDEFLPLLAKEFESSQSTVDRIIALSAFGSLGVEEIVPILLPVIRGRAGQLDNTAERVRAILSLHRVVSFVPEKIHPILLSLATNVAERSEVRQASISLLFMSNAPQSVWKQLAASTWFEPSKQVSTWIHSLLFSITKLPASSPFTEELSQKARVAWPMVKPAPFGLPFSFADIRSSYLDEGIAVMMHTNILRVADGNWPVLLGNRFVYQLGPFTADALSVYLWNYNMGDVWQNIAGKLYGRLSSKSPSRSHESISNLKGLWDELNATPRPADKRAGLLHINLMGSINRFINLEKFEESIPSFLAEAMKYQNTPYEVSVTKYRMLAEYNVRFPTELGLPMRFLATLPILVSMQGNLKGDGQGGIKSDIAAELSWKLSSEIRVEIPFNGNYIATGVDVRVDSRAPKELTFGYQSPGQIKVTWTPGSKVTDLLYYHVKPYTITRNWADSAKPIMEDSKVHIVHVNETPIERQLPLGDQFGVNIKYIEKSEMDFADKWSWANWIQKWDMNSISNLGFVPLEIRNRQYVIRYDPSGTHAKSVSTFFQYQHATKTGQHSVMFQEGSNQLKTLSEPEIVSSSAIVAEFRPVLGRLFKNVESGNAHLLRAGLTCQWKDGTSVHFNATMGLSKDAWYTKDFADIQIEKYSSAGPNVRANRKVDYNVCYQAVRNWNKPPISGFSKDVLYMTEEDIIAFGEQCDQNKIRFKAKIFRDEMAAKAAMSSPAGKQCQKDMASGFMYGSPACTEARQLDQTYNIYELTAEAENLPESVSQWANSLRQWVNHKLYPFTVKHVQGQNNNPKRASWIIKRDPWTGASNLTFVRPEETLVANNVRLGFTDWPRFSPLTWTYAQVFYPLRAGSNFVRDAVNITTGSVSESRCYVGPESVYTFDAGFYNYTVGDCPHVLLTDCHKQSEIAVTAYEGHNGHKIVTVIYGKDMIELDPTGYVTVNGAKTSFKSMEKETRFEIRQLGDKSIKAVVYPHAAEDSVVMEIKSLNLWIKVQGSHVELSAPPMHMRGRTCGMCGDFNQEIQGEWKTANRCAVSHGEIMAASFRLKSRVTGEKCSALNSGISRRLKKETETCQSIDKQHITYLPEYDVNAPSKSTRFEKRSFESQVDSQPGCNPYMLVRKPFTKCQGDCIAPTTVPASCLPALTVMSTMLSSDHITG